MPYKESVTIVIWRVQIVEIHGLQEGYVCVYVVEDVAVNLNNRPSLAPRRRN